MLRGVLSTSYSNTQDLRGLYRGCPPCFLPLAYRPGSVSRMEAPTGYEPLYTLKPIAPDVWISDGGWIRFYGLPFPTRMAIVRLQDGGLWVHSPIADRNGLSDAVSEIGPVRHLVAPNWLHYAWIPEWQDRFPDAVTWGAPGVAARAQTRGIDLQLDHTLGTDAPDDWAGQIDQILALSAVHREVLFLHRASRTLILTDLIENFEPDKMPWWLRPLLRLGGICDPDGGMPRDMAVGFWRRRDHLDHVVETLLDWAPERVILAHGRWYDRDGTAELRRAFRRNRS